MLSAESLMGNTQEEQLLDISKISDGQVLNVIAYAMSCTVKTSRLGQPFATFLLKDKNSNTIPARLFNVANGGEYSQLFARKPVRMRVEAQVYNGSLSLIIDGDKGVRVYNDDFDYAAFVGRYKVDLSTCAEIYRKLFDAEFPQATYERLSVDFLGSGCVGAFAKIMDVTLSDIMFMWDDADDVKKTELLKVFFISMHQLFLILTTYNSFGALQRILLSDAYAKINCDENLRLIVIDVLRSLCEGAKPLHLYSHIISSSVIRAHRMLQLCDSYATLVPGASSTIYFTDLLGGSVGGGVDLLKY